MHSSKRDVLRQESEDGVGVGSSNSHSEPESDARGGNDAEWQRFNILSLGQLICTFNLYSC